MAPRTRSVTNSPVKKTSGPSIVVTELKHNPMKVLVAPRCISENARVLSLKHPSDGSLKKFFFCPENGLFEVKRTLVPTIDPRSIIFAPAEATTNVSPSQTSVDELLLSEGFINKDAEILTATPFDLAFMLLASIAPEKTTTNRTLFQPLEDLLDSPESDDKSLRFVLNNGHSLVREAMSRVCDTVEAGDEQMFRYNEEKVFTLVLQRAQCVVESGLPASIEDRFVTRVLEAPILSIKREDTTTSSTSILQPTAVDEALSQEGSFDSQSTTVSTTVSTVFSEASDASTTLDLPEDTIPANIKQLQRVRTAYNFIATSCLPPFVAARLTPLLSKSPLLTDFAPLDNYLKNLSNLRAEAAATRSMSDFSRKRGLDDEEIAEDRAEKKRRLEEEEKRRKANESRGVRDLKKVNVTGMKKMSDFFSKKPPAAKTKA